MDSWGRFSYIETMRKVLPYLFVLCAFFVFSQSAEAAYIHRFSDTISNSAPSERSNHTVQFRTTIPIPAGGFIRFSPEDGNFEIPATEFDMDNVEIYTSTGGAFSQRAATVTPSATEDGVSITPGTSGNIEFTLNSTTGIPANADIRLIFGNNTANATGTDLGIMNPSSTGSYSYTIETGGGGTDGRAVGKVAIIEHVLIPDFDTRETIPPTRFNGAPSGTISGTTLIVQMSLETDEFARCRYSTNPDTDYFSMGNEFTSGYRTIHPANVTVATGTTYTFYVRCIDDEDNKNIDDYVISFSVPEYPQGNPGPDGSQEGEGSGVGEGAGDADPGLGDPSGGDDTSGGSSGGGGGGGGGGGSGASSGGSGGSGGFEGTDKAYQSGDARVIINGYAFPQSTVIILVDGVQADRVTATSNGSFTSTLDSIARGVYTFGVYAIDKAGVKSSTFSTTFSVTGARGSTLSNVNVMPSIKVSPDPVNPDSTVKFSGYAIPNATITIENQKDKSSASLKSFTTTSNGSGAWTLDVSTAGFSAGTYKVRAKAVQTDGISTNFSGYTFYGVGQAAAVPRSSDLNRDGKVNLTDFSILLYWWNTDGGTSNPPADINADGKVSLTDFSIMIFNWTG